MRLEKIRIQKYRSIEDITLTMPENKPLILFGPNNAGKSNILSAIDRLLGERYPTFIEMLPTDYYMRNKNKYPTATISAAFSHPYFVDKQGVEHKIISLTYGYKGVLTENLIHDGHGGKLFLKSEDRSIYQSYLIDAERNIQGAFNYSSKYSLLSKFSHRIHQSLTADCKEELSSVFSQIKASFEGTKEYGSFFEQFSSALKSSVKGFVHSLAVDFSAYDPNNYAKSLRIYAKEGDELRAFEEFGTGEQQVLLMAFVKAYMQVFTGESFVLIIEEPEAHLHPLAQKWLKEYIVDLCKTGIQVVISTHSTDFIDAEYLEGLVRVYKDGYTTKAIQLSPQQLCQFCIETGASESNAKPENIADFYATKLFNDQLKGMFAEIIILVEGATEAFSLPFYFRRIGFSLAEHGMEIIDCKGKNAIPLFWRLFKAYGYRCYAIFDGDAKTIENSTMFTGLIECNDWQTSTSSFVIENDYAYFGKDFESYFRSTINDYEKKEKEVVEHYGINSKPGRAKAIAQHCDKIPESIQTLCNKLILLEGFG